MTGYGRGEEIEAGFRFVVEIKALNHRHRDIIVRMPRELAALEDRARRLAQEALSRGRVEVFVNLETTEETEKHVRVDHALARAYYEALQELEAAFQLARGRISAHELALLPDVLALEKQSFDLERLAPALEKALTGALASLIRQRAEEGNRLARDIGVKLHHLKALALRIKERSPGILEDYRRKLADRLEELHQGKEFDQQRFYTETVLFAERCSIDEEIVRLQSHLEAFMEDLEKSEVVGRKLDFVLQEMHREINTISVKSNDLQISHLVVEAKSEIEKIREQIQNIE